MSEDIVPQKRCSKCGEEKPATTEYFARDNRRNDLQPKCKDCDRAYRSANSGRIKEYRREYNRTIGIEVRRAYRVANADRANELRRNRIAQDAGRYRRYGRLYRAANKDRIKRYNNEYRKKNRHIFIAKDLRRVARKRSLPDTFTAYHLQLCQDYWHQCCAVCGGQLRDLFGDIEPHTDHWIALRDTRPDNPGTAPENMICLCSFCNQSKGNKDPETWLTDRYGKHKASAIIQRIEAYFDWIKRQS